MPSKDENQKNLDDEARPMDFSFYFVISRTYNVKMEFHKSKGSREKVPQFIK